MSQNSFHQPISGMDVPRYAGPVTFMRLPQIPLQEAEGVDIGGIGVPWDGGTTNRPGARHGPRQVREMSAMIRRVHHVSRTSPYDHANVADLGDAPVNPADLNDALKRIEGFFKEMWARLSGR